jgi:hypothetical protein
MLTLAPPPTKLDLGSAPSTDEWRLPPRLELALLDPQRLRKLRIVAPNLVDEALRELAGNGLVLVVAREHTLLAVVTPT